MSQDDFIINTDDEDNTTMLPPQPLPPLFQATLSDITSFLQPLAMVYDPSAERFSDNSKKRKNAPSDLNAIATLNVKPDGIILVYNPSTLYRTRASIRREVFSFYEVNQPSPPPSNLHSLGRFDSINSNYSLNDIPDSSDQFGDDSAHMNELQRQIDSEINITISLPHFLRSLHLFQQDKHDSDFFHPTSHDSSHNFNTTMQYPHQHNSMLTLEYQDHGSDLVLHLKMGDITVKTRLKTLHQSQFDLDFDQMSLNETENDPGHKNKTNNLSTRGSADKLGEDDSDDLNNRVGLRPQLRAIPHRNSTNIDQSDDTDNPSAHQLSDNRDKNEHTNKQSTTSQHFQRFQHFLLHDSKTTAYRLKDEFFNQQLQDRAHPTTDLNPDNPESSTPIPPFKLSMICSTKMLIDLFSDFLFQLRADYLTFRCSPWETNGSDPIAQYSQHRLEELRNQDVYNIHQLQLDPNNSSPIPTDPLSALTPHQRDNNDYIAIDNNSSLKPNSLLWLSATLQKSQSLQRVSGLPSAKQLFVDPCLLHQQIKQSQYHYNSYNQNTANSYSMHSHQFQTHHHFNPHSAYNQIKEYHCAEGFSSLYRVDDIKKLLRGLLKASKDSLLIISIKFSPSPNALNLPSYMNNPDLRPNQQHIPNYVAQNQHFHHLVEYSLNAHVGDDSMTDTFGNPIDELQSLASSQPGFSLDGYNSQLSFDEQHGDIENSQYVNRQLHNPLGLMIKNRNQPMKTRADSNVGNAPLKQYLLIAQAMKLIQTVNNFSTNPTDSQIPHQQSAKSDNNRGDMKKSKNNSIYIDEDNDELVAVPKAKNQRQLKNKKQQRSKSTTSSSTSSESDQEDTRRSSNKFANTSANKQSVSPFVTFDKSLEDEIIANCTYTPRQPGQSSSTTTRMQDSDQFAGLGLKRKLRTVVPDKDGSNSDDDDQGRENKSRTGWTNPPRSNRKSTLTELSQDGDNSSANQTKGDNLVVRFDAIQRSRTPQSVSNPQTHQSVQTSRIPTSTRQIGPLPSHPPGGGTLKAKLTDAGTTSRSKSNHVRLAPLLDTTQTQTQPHTRSSIRSTMGGNRDDSEEELC